MKTFSTTVNDMHSMRGTFFDDATNEKMIASGHTKLITQYALSEYAAEGLGLKVAEGRWFTKEEFDQPYSFKQVPIILGSNYAGAFHIGDVVVYEDSNKHDEAVVVGILEPNAVVEHYGIVQGSFDDAVITTTASEFPRDLYSVRVKQDEVKFAARVERKNAAANRDRIRTLTSGLLYCPDESVDVQKAINDYTSKYGFYQIKAQPIDGSAYSETRSISERNLLLIGVLAVSTTVICMISLGGVLYNRTLDDRRTYCIYMSAGIPLWKINLSLILEMLFWMVLSILPVIALSLYEFQTLMIPLWQIGLFELIVMGVSIAPSLAVNSKCNLDLLIRNQMN